MNEIPTPETTIAELKKQNQELKEQLEKVYQIISFELGSPLRSLKSMIDLVQMDVESIDNPMVAESVGYLNMQMEKLLSQMANLLEWSGLQVKNYAFRPESFDVVKVLAHIREVFEKQAGNKGIEIGFLGGETPILVQGDKRMIQQAIGNLVSNSVKFCRKGDKIVLGVEIQESQAIISIKDTGIGMGKAKIANIFNPSRKSTQKGTANEAGLGLGMVTAKAMLDLHQSEIQISSEQGKGTEVTFSLKIE
jgi:signal transduction histidine kinase